MNWIANYFPVPHPRKPSVIIGPLAGIPRARTLMHNKPP